MDGTRHEIFGHPSFRFHERVHAGYDRETGLKCYVAIYDTRLGPPLGGTRIYPYDKPEDKTPLEDALDLARGMALKAALARCKLGGGKAVIIADPEVDKTETLLRAYGRFLFGLGKDGFITAEDSGMHVADIEIIANEIERLAKGTPLEGYPFVVGRTKEKGGVGDPSRFTARGVAAAMRAALRFNVGDATFRGRTFGIQGLGGRVGRNLAKIILEDGGIVIGAEINNTHLNDALKELECWKHNIRILEDPDAIFETKMDVFSPCALGGILNDKTIPRLQCQSVVGASNNQLKDTKNDPYRLQNRNIIFVTDYIANAAGLMAVFEELNAMREGRNIDENSILIAVDGIEHTVDEVLARSRQSGIPPALISDRIAKERIECRLAA